MLNRSALIAPARTAEPGVDFSREIVVCWNTCVYSRQRGVQALQRKQLTNIITIFIIVTIMIIVITIIITITFYIVV